MGNLLAVHVTPANEQDRAQVETLAKAVRAETGQSVKLGYGKGDPEAGEDGEFHEALGLCAEERAQERPARGRLAAPAARA